MQKITFRTAESIPPPYANQIEVKITPDENAGIEVDFSQTYLQRDELEEEDILEEGFTPDDDIQWNGTLNNEWKKAFEQIWEKRTKPKNLSSSAHDFFELMDEEEKSAPKNPADAKRFLEQMQQAIFEMDGREAALNIAVKEIGNDGERSTILTASFKNRSYTQTINNQPVEQPWNQLDEHLKLIFAGDFVYEKASNKVPSKRGLYVNMGDDWWFEVGKSLLIQPQKISGFLV